MSIYGFWYVVDGPNAGAAPQVWPAPEGIFGDAPDGRARKLQTTLPGYDLAEIWGGEVAPPSSCDEE